MDKSLRTLSPMVGSIAKAVGLAVCLILNFSAGADTIQEMGPHPVGLTDSKEEAEVKLCGQRHGVRIDRLKSYHFCSDQWLDFGPVIFTIGDRAVTRGFSKNSSPVGRWESTAWAGFSADFGDEGFLNGEFHYWYHPDPQQEPDGRRFDLKLRFNDGQGPLKLKWGKPVEILPPTKGKSLLSESLTEESLHGSFENLNFFWRFPGPSSRTGGTEKIVRYQLIYEEPKLESRVIGIYTSLGWWSAVGALAPAGPGPMKRPGAFNVIGMSEKGNFLRVQFKVRGGAGYLVGWMKSMYDRIEFKGQSYWGREFGPVSCPFAAYESPGGKKVEFKISGEKAIRMERHKSKSWRGKFQKEKQYSSNEVICHREPRPGYTVRPSESNYFFYPKYSTTHKGKIWHFGSLFLRPTCRTEKSTHPIEEVIAQDVWVPHLREDGERTIEVNFENEDCNM